jgi:hypothetical protein
VLPAGGLFLAGQAVAVAPVVAYFAYFYATGNPDWFQEDLMRYKGLGPSDVQAVATTYLSRGRVVLSIVPEGRRDLAAGREIS